MASDVSPWKLGGLGIVDLAKRVSNWGRWGDDDEIGTINLVTPDVRRRAAGCVKTGKAFSLALPLDTVQGIQTGAMPLRINPIRTMTMINTPLTGDPSEFCTSDDVVTMGLQAATHWDGLGHVSYDGKIYNVFPAASLPSRSVAVRIHRSPLLNPRLLLDLSRRRASGARRRTRSPPTPCRGRGAVSLPVGRRHRLAAPSYDLLRSVYNVAWRAAPAPGGTVEWFHARTWRQCNRQPAFEASPRGPAVVLPVHLLHCLHGHDEDRTGCGGAGPTAPTTACTSLEARPAFLKGGLASSGGRE